MGITTPHGPATPQQGFTLVELLTVLAVMAVLAVLALPALDALMDRQSVDQAANALARATRLARSEAIKRGEVVTVCAKDTAQGDQGLACLPRGRVWSGGLVVYVDRGKRGTLEEDDLVLWVEQAGARAPTVSATLRYMSFQASGVSLNAASHFDYLPASGHPQDAAAHGARRLCINKPGRVRSVPISESCA